MTIESNEYKSAGAFRQALEDRLKNRALNGGMPLDRLRRRVSFDRFLVRIFCKSTQESHWILLKGGYALELRFQGIARSTKDIDLTLPNVKNTDENTIRIMLQTKAKQDRSDWFVFYIGTPMMELKQTRYAGWRYPVETRVANRIFSKFHLDVSIGDSVISEPEWKRGEDILAFAGIEPADIAVIPVEQHFAEKLHAYSYPRDKRYFSRIRDLVDLVLLIEYGIPNKELLLGTIKATFTQRKTHCIPMSLEYPPSGLENTYAELAEDYGVTRKTMVEAYTFSLEYWKELRE